MNLPRLGAILIAGLMLAACDVPSTATTVQAPSAASPVPPPGGATASQQGVVLQDGLNCLGSSCFNYSNRTGRATVAGFTPVSIGNGRAGTTVSAQYFLSVHRAARARTGWERR